MLALLGSYDPKGSVFNLDLYSLFLVNKELLSLNHSCSLAIGKKRLGFVYTLKVEILNVTINTTAFFEKFCSNANVLVLCHNVCTQKVRKT